MTGLTVAVVVLAMTACTDDGDRADDPAGSGSTPSESVAPVGEVTTKHGATVMDTGRPELCVGPIAESYPPQCRGPALEGWDWSAYEGDYQQVGDVRWGVFDVTGTWDGTTFTVDSAVASP